MIFLMLGVQALLILFVGFLSISGKLKHTYALSWTMGISTVPLILTSTNLLERTSKYLGFQLTSNFILVIAMLFLILNSIWLLSIIGRLEEKTRLLVVEVSLLKNEVRNISAE